MILLVSTPILRGHPGSEQVSPTSLPFPPTSRLAARQLFRVPPCREGTIYLETSMSSLVFKPRPYVPTVSVTNHYTGCAENSKI
ncbi:hypothetical protein TNCV_2725571 [Trichonephila clavipes]|nr:hypothetical protein TNCV_2725571 [Trichonephila clavipes]